MPLPGQQKKWGFYSSLNPSTGTNLKMKVLILSSLVGPPDPNLIQPQFFPTNRVHLASSQTASQEGVLLAGRLAAR